MAINGDMRQTSRSAHDARVRFRRRWALSNMRIIVTSDLHYNVARSKAPTQAIAREICKRGGDCLLFVGDLAGADLAILDEVLALFEPFRGIKMAVAGNHELWTFGGGDSLDRYENEVAGAFARNGVHYLDAAPLQVGHVAFAGNVGWYDFSFRPSSMRIPLRFYRHKVAPGAAAYFEKHRHLLERDDDVPAASREVTSRWMDGERVRLPISDVEFTQRSANRLREHLEAVEQKAERIVVAVHHLPFAELVPPTILPNWAFAGAFLGSDLLGETILDFPKASHVFCGHSHRARECRRGALVCKSIGSTYREKQYDVLDV
ncbi:MAG: hypothetical protein B6D36_03345 [Planctomycetes bacterium UTPLA1]|nr:MAG: hypothetical protein B6D36_03345 [Planctomycetes bacterium UTPLA1]